MEPLLAARLQMALTLGFHIIFACFGVGLPVLLLVAEGRYLRTRDEGWRTIARRWSKSFGVLFAVGAVSGTVLSFELGLLWPDFMGTFGSVIGLPFTMEAFAFFLEAIFVGIYIYTWDRLPPRAHWLSGFPIAVAGIASAAFVVTANAWMNCPQGFLQVAGKVVYAEPLRAMLNPASGPQVTHMVFAAGLVAGFGVASVYAAGVLRGKDSPHRRRALALGLAMGAICAPLQVLSGDWAARVVARTQPVKFAAMEGQFRTEARAPLRIGGLPDSEAETTRFALEIPGGLSWLACGDPGAVVNGLDRVPRADRPPVAIVHLAFQAMVGAGVALLALSGWVGGTLVFRKRLPRGRAFLWCVALAGPLAAVALEAGWVVTEVGRQPWIVQGIMRTRDAVTDAPGVGWVFLVALAIYSALTGATIIALRHLARK
ncbi:MAG TPA: cytochrome ubiquinol oxidase subunit I [Planctomycetota bacterium]|jgi:cytochrome d ubiquinol oxidase subunit I